MLNITLIILGLIVYYFTTRLIGNFLLHMLPDNGGFEHDEWLTILWIPIIGEALIPIIFSFRIAAKGVLYLDNKIEKLSDGIKSRFVR